MLRGFEFVAVCRELASARAAMGGRVTMGGQGEAELGQHGYAHGPNGMRVASASPPRLGSRGGIPPGEPADPPGRADLTDCLRRWAPMGLAALFLGSGTLHLVRPGLYLNLIPRALPAPGAIVFASGIAELVCAGGLLAGARWAGRVSALLLLVVFPGNVSVAIASSADPAASPLLVAAAWVRLPLQVPLIWAALQSPSR